MAVLRNVPKTFSFDDQRVEINEMAQDLFDLSSANAIFSVQQNSPGVTLLQYDVATGVLEFTPPNLSAFLTSYTETDPIFGASPASGITATNINDWNAAYTMSLLHQDWGDHSLEGYLTTLPSHNHDLSNLDDVSISSPADGEAIVWNQTTGKWQAQQILMVGINQFTVQTVSASSGGSLGYNQGTGVFTYAPADLSSVSTFSGSYPDLTNKPTIPAAQVQSDWNASSGLAEILNKPTLFSGSYNDLTDKPTISEGATVTVSDTAPSTPSNGDLWFKSDEAKLKVRYEDGSSDQWVDALPLGSSSNGGGGGGGSSSILYADVSSFPAVADSESKFAYADDTGVMYYSNGVSWTSQRLVTTNSTTSSDFATLLGNTQLTYNINVVDFNAGTAAENLARKIIRLEDSGGTTDQIVLVAGTGLAISDSGDEIQIDLTADIANSTYSISAESAAGNADSILRLTDNAGTTDDITFAGADGLLVERTDANTLTFRAPSGASGGSYTTEDAQDAAALLFSNGTHSNITFTYDDNNNSISAAVTGGGGGGTTYDLLGSNTTSNNAILTLRDAANNDDAIEFAGSNGTDITWDSANSKITINSTAPVQPDWDATTGLAQILNKPSIPSAYTLPAATTSTLGGVIPDGTTITLDASGNISAVPAGYTLPIAAAGTLGGIKVGSGLSIDAAGVLTATGGSSVPQIQDLTGTTSSLADDATAELNITGYKAYSLFKIEVDAAAWVRVYTDDASRDADQTRSEGADPSPGSGVIAEVRTTTAESILITPGIMGFNNDSPRTTTIYLSVTNRSGSASTVTVTLTALQIGE